MATVNATMDTNNAGFQLPITITSSGESNYLLRTADTYLNKDITITTSTAPAVPAADNANADVTLFTTDGSNAGVNISGIVGTKTTTEPTSGYYLAFKGSGRSKITTAGWIGTGALDTSTSDAKYFPITAANGSITKVSQSLTPTASLEKSNTLTWSDSDTSGISVTAKGNASGSLSARIDISQAGYVPSGNNWKSGSLTISAAGTPASAIKYLTEVSIASGKSFTVTNAGTLTVTNTGTTTVTSNSTSAGTIAIKAKVTAGDTNTTNINIVENGLLKVANPTFSAAPNGGSTASSSQVTMDTTSTSAGIEIQTAYNINAATITYKAAATGWINKAKDASTGSSTTAKSSTNGTKYYVTGITVPASKSLAVTNNGTTTVTNNDTITITSGIASSTPKGTINVNAYPTSGTTLDGSKKIVENGRWITTSVSAGGTYYGKVTIGTASFNNTATDGVSYTDYDASAPIIPSGGYLYINAGYTPARKISLAKLVPNEVTVGETVEDPLIHPTCTAYNVKGEIVVGTMIIYGGDYTITT